MNKVVLIGRMTKDPEFRYTQGKGTPVCTFTLAVDRRMTNKDGEREADFIPIIVFGKIGEATATHMKKGRLIGVSGRVQTRSYDDKQGVKKYITEVMCDEVDFIDWGGNKKQDKSKDIDQMEEIPIDDGDMPF